MSEEYSTFISRINGKLGIDLTLYKEVQMKRRLTSLRNKRGFLTFDDYFRALENHTDLLKEFVDRITINVSEFYRNPKRWHVLESSILPYLMNSKEQVTIWSAACSTGEEPYSIALLMKEHYPHKNFKILATDIDENVLVQARQGVYKEQALKDLPVTMREKYFKKDQGLYHLDNKIKELVLFKRHNLLSDNYPKKVDLIICRNVLIYFTDHAKNSIYQHFSNVLNQNGILFVGSTEQIFTPNRFNFRLLDTFFYQKI
ncbi:CheR family methyltransferase [Virgibacillus byunsanensis]|uniref:protein-glutamate O-methyltransferase n=1 Tax=Virgibacillus byunsanensis TaxID=570945 RepID=A0ABW3LJX5_9BACI